MQNNQLTPDEVLQRIPQQHPFRFIDHILDMDENQITAEYRFRPDEFFYAGHFPGHPITPGVILLETMAQTGVVAHGIYLLSLAVGPEEIGNYLSIFSDGVVEFYHPVLPGDRVICKAKKIFWRQKKLKSQVEMYNDKNQLVASSTVSGIGVPK